ncbi:MAG: glycoside hydrolase family 78 protein [Chitinophagaceae bacterium]|nr:glycoside hydrolase family 78 protein [Chitinophagaceae bacterium]
MPVALLLSLAAVGQVLVSGLQTNSLINPMGVLPGGKPVFSWILQTGERNVLQQAYEIKLEEVAPSGKLKPVWQTGRVADSRSVQVPFLGSALKPNTRYRWQVRVWVNTVVTPTAWSEPAVFHTAMASAAGWQAQWIVQPSGFADTVGRPAQLFRKAFAIGKKPVRAMLFITTQGMYTARLNGARVSSDWLTPGWTSYNKRLQYQVYDVTQQVKQGQNALAVTVGNGWYRSPLGWVTNRDIYGSQLAVLAQLQVHFADGTSVWVNTDNSWKTATGSIRFSEIYNGETVDMRRQEAGWDTPGFNDAKWTNATIAAFDKERLLPTINEPVTSREVFKPVRIFTTPNGETVADFGQNLVGWVRLKANGQPGDTITVTHAEVLDKQGNMYYTNLRGAACTNKYVTDGKGENIFHPHFSWQGFRYAAIKGMRGGLSADNLEAVALYSDMPVTGTFSSSHALVNQLQHNIQWGQRGNFLDVPTDCPQRDERLGWTGDAQAFSATAAYNFGVRNFFAKWLADVEADQVEGAVPWVVPNVLSRSNVNSAGWSDVATIIPWNMYLAYGDTAVLSASYAAMKAYLGSLQKAAGPDNLWDSGFHFGDWLFYRPDDDNDGRAAVTDKYLIAQCFYAHSADLLAKAAKVLGNSADAAYYRQLAVAIRAAFQKEYLTPSGRLVSGTQTAYVLALQFDMLPEAQRQQAAARLAHSVKDYGHLTTGFLGTPYINHLLTKYGYHDLAIKLLLRVKYPSWLYPVTMGATTIWERWDGQKPDSSFQNPGMNSFNHYAYGAIGDWLYKKVAGIDVDENAPGYRHIIYKPYPVDTLGHVKAELTTPYGKAAAEWELRGDKAYYKVVVPPNTTASVYLPVQGSTPIMEQNQMLKAQPVAGDTKDSRALIKIGSGTYVFSFEYKPVL